MFDAHPVRLASDLGESEDTASCEADVIVVGAGPAGSATATFLARVGIDVLLLEKFDFPREKVCGDGLTPRAVRMLTRLGIDTSPESGWRRTKGLKIYSGRPEPLTMPWPQLNDFPDYGLTCARSRFDDILAGNAVAAGAKLRTNVKVTKPLMEKGRTVGVESADGRTFRAPLVVACDGNSARLGLQLGRERIESRPMGVAVRSYYSGPKADLEWLESFLELWDGSNLLPGYGWIFGLGEGRANIGLGILNTSQAFAKTDYRTLLKRWISATPEEWGLSEETRLEPIRGAALPMAFNRKPVYADGLMLVGDAAGMVSPFNGEGISYAMEAGEMAAEAIADAHARGFDTSSGERALHAYGVRLSDAWGGYFRMGTTFVKLIGNPHIMKICTKYGLPRKQLMKLVHKLLANLTDARPSDANDRLINFLSRVAPST